jgi:hypothetical protein
VAKGEWAETTRLIEESVAILKLEHPATIRQLFYRLVDGLWIPNSQSAYQKVSRIMKKAREDGRVPYEWIVDRTRPVYSPNVWDNLSEYLEATRNDYRRNYWLDQPNYCEIWSEKDAAVGSIRDLADELGVTVRVGRGFQSVTNKKIISNILNSQASKKKSLHIFYLGDFDPSGEDIERDVFEKIQAKVRARINHDRLGILKSDISHFKLPTQKIKDDDSRSDGFRKRHGKRQGCVELSALPPTELRRRVRTAITNLLDRAKWNRAIKVEKVEMSSIEDFVNRWTAGGGQ